MLSQRADNGDLGKGYLMHARRYVLFVLVLMAGLLASPIPAGAGSGKATCRGQRVTVDLNFGQVPTEGNDVIKGTKSADIIDALEGDDLV